MFVSPEFNISSVIESGSIESHFQPIISVRRKSFIGVEALSRGINPDNSLISPIRLFEAAAAADLTLELDRLCRAKALKAFLPLHRQHPELILFLNLHPATFDLDSSWMLEAVREMQIDPRNVALEVLETQFEDVRVLRRATERYKAAGFLVAVDDMGVGFSNLDRVAELKPDILKADLSLIRDINREYHKQEIFKSLVHLSEKIGGWIISEGIETAEEAVCALQLGGDIAQGYYFATPHKLENDQIACKWNHVEKIGAEFKSQMLDRIKTDVSHREQRHRITSRILAQLAGAATADFDRRLFANVDHYETLESACVLDQNGIQISETVFNSERLQQRKTVIFRPPPKGTDHSLKEYYYVPRETNARIYETGPYVPLPSGKLCVTVSSGFKNAAGDECILCLHFDGLAHIQYGLYPETSGAGVGIIG